MKFLKEIYQYLAEANTPDLETELAPMKRALEDAMQEADKIRSRGATFGGGAVAPQYRNQLERSMARIRAIREKIKLTRSNYEAKGQSAEWHRDYATKQASKTDADRKKEHNKAIGDGIRRANELRKEFGGWRGLEDEIVRRAMEITQDGTEHLDVDQLAGDFGFSDTRTMYKWLERPRLNKTLGLLKPVQGGWKRERQ